MICYLNEIVKYLVINSYDVLRDTMNRRLTIIIQCSTLIYLSNPLKADDTYMQLKKDLEYLDLKVGTEYILFLHSSLSL